MATGSRDQEYRGLCPGFLFLGCINEVAEEKRQIAMDVFDVVGRNGIKVAVPDGDIPFAPPSLLRSRDPVPLLLVRKSRTGDTMEGDHQISKPAHVPAAPIPFSCVATLLCRFN
jgi:hypothetical protein